VGTFTEQTWGFPQSLIIIGNVALRWSWWSAVRWFRAAGAVIVWREQAQRRPAADAGGGAAGRRRSAQLVFGAGPDPSPVMTSAPGMEYAVLLSIGDGGGACGMRPAAAGGLAGHIR
jgi:hypothetical protein